MDHYEARKLVKRLVAHGIEARWEDLGEGSATVIAEESREGSCHSTHLESAEDVEEYINRRRGDKNWWENDLEFKFRQGIEDGIERCRELLQEHFKSAGSNEAQIALSKLSDGFTRLSQQAQKEKWNSIKVRSK